MLLEKEKGIPVDYMIEQIKRAIVVACKNLYGNENIDITMDPEKNSFNVKMIKTVVEEIEDEANEILLEDAKQISKRAAVGKEIGIPLDPKSSAELQFLLPKTLSTVVSVTAKRVRCSESSSPNSRKSLLQQLRESTPKQATQQSASAKPRQCFP